MRRLLMMRVSPPELDWRFAWIAGFLILAYGTALAVRMLPEVGLIRGAILIASIGTGWLVMMALVPRHRPVETRTS